MDEQTFIALLQSEEQGAVGYYNSEIARDQEQALKYYNGDKFGNEEEGHSTVVSRDVASTIDSVMPDLIRVFVSGDNVVEFEPTKIEEEEYAEQATDYINHIFFKDNDGFTITHDWAKDGLLNKIGIVKAYWEKREEKKKEEYEGLTEEDLILLAQEVEIVEATTDEEAGLTDVVAHRVADASKICIENVPPEEFLVSRRTRTLEDAHYVAHKCRKTVSELVEMGYDRAKVEAAGGSDQNDFDTRSEIRYDEEDYDEASSDDKTMRQVWVLEEYIQSDYDGDGIAELRKVTRINKTIFDNVEVDEHPFVEFTPIKLPHRIFGKSLADDTMDIQLIKSTLIRQALDNLYMTNNPRIEVPDSIVTEDTFDDILTPRPGAPIRTKGAGGLNAIALPFTAGQSFDMIEYWDGEKEQRTGVTRYNQGLDADTLNKTASGIAMIQNKGMGKIELITRNLARSFGLLFRKILRTTHKYQQQERVIQLRGKWVPIHPQNWNPDMKVREQVGLGTGDKEKRIQSRMALLELQREGLQSGLCTVAHIHNNLSALIRDMELGEIEQYANSPDQVPPQQEQPDPKIIELQQKAVLEREKMQLDFQLKQEQMAAEIQLKREQMVLEAQFKTNMTDNIEMGGEIG